MNDINENNSFDEMIMSLASSLPEPIKQNLFTSIGQLFSSSLGIPIQKLINKRNEMVAESEARIKIIKSQGDMLADRVTVPQGYIDMATEKFLTKIVQERMNIDDVLRKTVKQLFETSAKVKGDSDEFISNEWLNEFDRIVSVKSSEDMKHAFSKILASEIQKPGSFSLRTLRIMSQLDTNVAKTFQLLCSLSTAHCKVFGNNVLRVIDRRVISPLGNAAINALGEFGIWYEQLNLLHEYGLINPDYNSYHVYNDCVKLSTNDHTDIIFFNNKYYELSPIVDTYYPQELRFEGVSLTYAGMELSFIVDLLPSDTYKHILDMFLKSKYLELKEIKIHLAHSNVV